MEHLLTMMRQPIRLVNFESFLCHTQTHVSVTIFVRHWCSDVDALDSYLSFRSSVGRALLWLYFTEPVSRLTVGSGPSVLCFCFYLEPNIRNGWYVTFIPWQCEYLQAAPFGSALERVAKGIKPKNKLIKIWTDSEKVTATIEDRPVS